MAVLLFLLLRRLLLWNSLPQHIRDAGSLDIFKKTYEIVLFRRAFLN